MRYVILGGSIAGLSAVKAIRERDRSGEIVLVSNEQGPAYYRPLIPLLVDGSRGELDLAMTGNLDQWLGVNVSFRTAERIDTAGRTVFLSGSRKLAYDRLLIATGARPIIPGIAGIDSRGVHTLRTLADARKLRTAAGTAHQVVVIGGGMVGIKAATALAKLGPAATITIVEQEDHLLPRRLDAHGAGIISDALARDGIRIVAGTTVAGVITRSGRCSGVKLANGTSLPADLVIAAIGVQPNVEFLAGSGITVQRGVVVDASLETSVQGVFAAGDAAECRDAVTGDSFVSGLWTNAVEMGRLAGMNMAGGKAAAGRFLSVMNAAEIAGVPFISAGVVDPGPEFESAATTRDGNYWKVVMRDGLVTGISFVGEVRNAGVYVNMIRNRIPVKGSRHRLLRGAATYADVACMTG